MGLSQTATLPNAEPSSAALPTGESCHEHAIHIGKYYEFLKPLQLSMRAGGEVNCLSTSFFRLSSSQRRRKHSYGGMYYCSFVTIVVQNYYFFSSLSSLYDKLHQEKLYSVIKLLSLSDIRLEATYAE